MQPETEVGWTLGHNRPGPSPRLLQLIYISSLNEGAVYLYNTIAHSVLGMSFLWCHRRYNTSPRFVATALIRCWLCPLRLTCCYPRPDVESLAKYQFQAVLFAGNCQQRAKYVTSALFWWLMKVHVKIKKKIGLFEWCVFVKKGTQFLLWFDHILCLQNSQVQERRLREPPQPHLSQQSWQSKCPQLFQQFQFLS